MMQMDKSITKAQLKLEQRALKELKMMYEQAKKDCQKQISALNSRQDMQNLQTIIYQKKYQDAMLKQIDSVLNDLNSNQYQTLLEFFNGSYATGYIGSMYDLQKQGIPVISPVDPQKMTRAIMTDSKLSKLYYQKRILPENLSTMKRNIRREMTRGIASGKTWVEIAYQIGTKMNSPFNRAMHDAMRIARTEGHRINQEGFIDAGDEATGKGADIVKQWDATLDNATRPWHQEADGQIREWNDCFEVDGEKMKAPSVGGSARNVCNCRCQLLQRARWALDKDELKKLQDRASFFGLDKSKSFEEFKQKYLKLPDDADKINVGTLPKPTDSSDPHYNKLFKLLNRQNVDYNPVQNQTKKMSEEEIINHLAGWDKTDGSCASVGLAYIGQKQGLDVLDFRGGKSEEFFSNALNLYKLSQVDGIKSLKADGKCSLTVGNRLLKQVEEGKEYYLCVGRHASIVRKTKEGKLQYLELQADVASGYGGWHDFDKNARYTLNKRFVCTSTSDHGASSTYDFMIDIDESDFSTDDFKALLGYINTSSSDEQKGMGGAIR